MGNNYTYLVIHCTATKEGQNISSDTIRKWHLGDRGWSRVGYSDMFHLNGEYENLTAYDGDSIIDKAEMTWGVKGKNSISRHCVYVGGVDGDIRPKDTRTEEQKLALRNYVHNQIIIFPNIKIAGHNQFSNKACPSFNVPQWCRSIGIPEKNIHDGNGN